MRAKSTGGVCGIALYILATRSDCVSTASFSSSSKTPRTTRGACVKTLATMSMSRISTQAGFICLKRNIANVLTFLSSVGLKSNMSPLGKKSLAVGKPVMRIFFMSCWSAFPSTRATETFLWTTLAVAAKSLTSWCIVFDFLL